MGWLLGLFSPWFAEQIQRPSQKSKIKTGIFEEFQRLAHRIRGRLTILNQDIEISWFYFQKTFDSSLSDLNRGLIAENQDACQRAIRNMARLICDDIQAILQM